LATIIFQFFAKYLMHWTKNKKRARVCNRRGFSYAPNEIGSNQFGKNPWFKSSYGKDDDYTQRYMATLGKFKLLYSDK